MNQRKNQISEVIDSNGNIQSTNDSIAEAFIDLYHGIFNGEAKENMWISNLDWNAIDSKHHASLTSSFKEDEVRKTVLSFEKGKASGPDDFTMLFFKKYWATVKNDITGTFDEFHMNGIINKNVNNTYIALIGKKNICVTTSDYKPISLTTSLYKILAKTLANRLRITLEEMVAENQMAFVEDKQITDAILITNEAIDYWEAKKIKGCVLKLDIEKAFDKVNWAFIDYMLKVKNYPSKWRSWIKACIVIMCNTPSSLTANPMEESNQIEASDKVIHYHLSFLS